MAVPFMGVSFVFQKINTADASTEDDFSARHSAAIRRQFVHDGCCPRVDLKVVPPFKFLVQIAVFVGLGGTAVAMQGRSRRRNAGQGAGSRYRRNLGCRRELKGTPRRCQL